MPYDGSENDWREGGEPPRETIVHAHPSLPFIEIRQTRYVEALPGEEKFENWEFIIRGPDGAVARDNVIYRRGDATEPEMIASLAARAERHLLDDRGPVFVLRAYLETGQFRREIDAVIRKHGQSPLGRRIVAVVTRHLGLERDAIRMRYRLRGEKPGF